MLRIWPSEFEGREHIIKEERDILRTAKKYIKNGHWVTGINPHGLGTTNNSRMGMYISPSEGLISYSIVSGPIEPSMIDMYIMTVELNENLIYERLIDSKILIARNGNVKKLKFPYKHVLIFHG